MNAKYRRNGAKCMLMNFEWQPISALSFLVLERRASEIFTNLIIATVNVKLKQTKGILTKNIYHICL